MAATPSTTAPDTAKPRSAREVGDVPSGGVGATLRLLPVLLAAERGQVEEGGRPAGPLRAAGEGGVRVEHLAVHGEERADARLFGGAVERPAEPGRRQLVTRSVVELHGSDGGVEADVEVVVEVAAVRRVPREGPAPLRLVALELGQRRP